MKITIRPDPDCIELIRSEFKDMIIGFLKSVGVLAKDAKNWEAVNTIEINESNPPLVDVFDMKCYLPDEIFTKSEWLFKFKKNGFVSYFVISELTVCCKILSTDGLKFLPKNLLNLYCSTYEIETLDENFKDLTNYSSLKCISFKNCIHLKNISLLENLDNLQSLNLSGCSALVNICSLFWLEQLRLLNLSGCESLIDVKILFKLNKLISLNLSNCTSITDISSLFGLENLRSLDLSWCKSLYDISSLSGLVRLRSLNLSWCNQLADISNITQLVNLQVLNLSNCDLLSNISSLFGLENLRSLDLSWCKSLYDISSLSGLIRLRSLNLSWCNQLADISSLAHLVNLQVLNLSNCDLLSNINSISSLFNLKKLDLSYFQSINSTLFSNLYIESRNNNLKDISPISNLVNLQFLNLFGCSLIKDISPISNLVNLQFLNLFGCSLITDIHFFSRLINLRSIDLCCCKSLTDISSLSGLLNLQSLNLEECKRIQSISSLRNCLALKDLKESKMHPTELAELLCFLAVQRKDIHLIYQKAGSWLKELELGLCQKHSSSNDLAYSLAQGIIRANLDQVGLSFHQTLLNYPDAGIAPWKIWFSENLKTFGWDKIQKLAESNKPSELTFGAIAGISSCLSSMEDDPVQIGWAKKWITEIHSLHNTTPSFLKPAAAEWCLALKRLGEDELLREWIEKFTDPSDPSALDPINKVFSAYALDLNDSESALEYALKINDPKFRDESILNLAQQFIKEGETSKAGEFLFLLTQVESRIQLAYSLAEDAAYLKNDENEHRLLAACGNNRQFLSNILDKIQIGNLDSEILKIKYKKLGDESVSQVPPSLIMQESNNFTNTLLKIKDPSQLLRIQEAIISVMKSN
jgi:Leucine-rich repeat (LRR) protein